jgi:hypothetical protein
MKTHTNHRPSREVRDHVHRKDDANAFLPDPDGGEAHSDDSLAENLAEVYLQTATSGEEAAEDVMNELVAEELGGPFVDDVEESLGIDADVVPPPRPVRRRSKPS